MRAAHEDLQKENESLRAEQISSAQEGFEPPCLKCIERDNATSVAECSTATAVAISSTVDVVTNPSAEDTTAIADENARLKTLAPNRSVPLRKDLNHLVLNALSVIMLLLLLNVLLLLLLQYLQLLMW